MSHTTIARRLVSSSNCFTYRRSLRPRIFQSTWRRSSPGWYIRCSANSTENPRRGDRWRPARKPSTTPSVTTSTPPSFETSKGSSRSSRTRLDEIGGGIKGGTYPAVRGKSTRPQWTPRSDTPSSEPREASGTNVLLRLILCRYRGVAHRLLRREGFRLKALEGSCSSPWDGCCSPASPLPRQLRTDLPPAMPRGRPGDAMDRSRRTLSAEEVRRGST